MDHFPNKPPFFSALDETSLSLTDLQTGTNSRWAPGHRNILVATFVSDAIKSDAKFDCTKI